MILCNFSLVCHLDLAFGVLTMPLALLLLIFLWSSLPKCVPTSCIRCYLQIHTGRPLQKIMKISWMTTNWGTKIVVMWTVDQLDGKSWGPHQNQVVTAFQHLILREFGGTKAVTHGSQFQYGEQFHDQVSPYLGIALLKG